MTTLRSILFLVGGLVITAFFGILVPAGGLFGFHAAAWMASTYTRVMLRWIEWSVGIGYEVDGWDNVPDFPVIVMAKHQSAWETLFMEGRLPPQCWIVKKELLWLPFVGWSLMAIRAIAIDRSSGQSAREQIVEQGARRLKQGMWVSIFPEGTRIAPGKTGRYGIGGAMLATRTGTPILPIAHNAGEYWPRYAFRKRPGTIKVVIGPLIQTAGRDVLSVNNEVQGWIEGQMRSISPDRYAEA
ncbi:MAG: 1-acyl-sn-glycerol-3-phosphate acyltransferase [Pseudomonadota bacterium]|nr:1-acyl-sn-glycerol-3-phosphate acyltransferase [Pseudomonadota bacterium]